MSLVNAKQKYSYNNLLASTTNQAVLFKTVSDLWNKKQVKVLPSNNGEMVTLANDFNHFFTEKVEKIRYTIHCDSEMLFELEDAVTEPSSILHTFEPATPEELKDYF